MKKTDKLLIIAIVAPILIALVVFGGPVITNITKAIVPNFWALIAHVYIAVIAYIIGRKAK